MSPLRLLTLALLTASVAGCSDDGGAPPAAGDHPFARAGPVAGQSVLRFAGLDAPVETTVWSNGSVAFQDTCNTGGCLTGTERAFIETDITGDLPVGVPVEVAVAMRTTTNPVFGTFEVFLQAPESTVYYHRFEIDHALGTADVQAMLLPQGPVAVVLAANAPGGDAPETDYELAITITAGPERVPAGAPVGLELGPGSNLTFQAPGQTRPPFLLYGPDDAYLGRFEGNVTLPPTARRGEYVVLVPTGAPWGNLSSDADTQLRGIGLATELGPAGSLPPNEAYDAAWDVTGFPFAVGVLVSNDPAATPIGGPLLSTGFEATLTGANGFAIESGPMCGLCITFGFQAGFGSGTGNELVVAQTYQVHAASSGVTQGLVVTPFARYLDRA